MVTNTKTQREAFSNPSNHSTIIPQNTTGVNVGIGIVEIHVNRKSNGFDFTDIINLVIGTFKKLFSWIKG